MLDRSVHGNPGVDAAPDDDGGGVDAPPIDMGLPIDAPPPMDMGPPDTGSSCTPMSIMETACDRIDEDCDGNIDDDSVCVGCIAITVGGRAFLSCAGPVTGFAAWAGACRTTAPGYELATFDNAGQQNAVANVLNGRGLTDAHWIGLNDFDASGTYVWFDHSPDFLPGLVGGNDPAKRFVVLRADGGYEELIGNEPHRFLCEAVRPPGACANPAEAAACNGVDDDCDGHVDEGLDCGSSHCTASTFWDRAYYVCTRGRNAMESAGDCPTVTGGALVTMNGPIEHVWVASQSGLDVWIGLTQGMDSRGPEAGWGWQDSTSTYGVPAVVGVGPWNAGEPNDNGGGENNQENCAMLGVGTHNFDDRGCNANFGFVCERGYL